MLPRIVLCALTLFAAPALAKPDPTLARLLDADWRFQLSEHPTWATSLGEHRYDDRLTDYSPAALARRKRQVHQLERALRRIDRRRLNENDRLSYDLLRDRASQDLRMLEIVETSGVGEHWDLVGYLDGLHIAFSGAIATFRFENANDYRNYLARLAAMPRQIEQATQLARQGLASGWSMPRVTLSRVGPQIDALIGNQIEAHSWYRPFARMPGQVGAAEAAQMRTEAQRVLRDEVNPALRRLQIFVAEEYAPKARTSIAASDLPNGRAYYAARVARMTSTLLSPEQIHEIGLGEVARITARMDAIARAQGYSGKGTDFLKAVRARPDQYFATPAEALAGYEAVGKRVDPLMATMFRTLPRTPWGVRAASPEERGGSAHYVAGAPDGSRAGYFVVDVSDPKGAPKFEMTALVLHEGVPGHHLQGARAAELESLPQFRRHAWDTAYGEGWALYAEALGEELGLYATPLELLGRYSYELWRAARLVLDTGIHAKGWSREQAMAYLAELSGESDFEVANAIDRYILWPGQALGYKIGELTIQRLRREASAALGGRFDLRDFHNLLLDAGPLPLSLLERRVRDWVDAQQRRPDAKRAR